MNAVHAWLSNPFLGRPTWLWASFGAIVAALLAFDLGLLSRDERTLGARESLWLSGGYIGVGLAFGGLVGWALGAASGWAYLTGFVLEKALSLDNIFVIAMILSSFAIPTRHQHRVLFWGIWGVLALRGVMIAGGAALLTRFSWLLEIFGVILILTGIKMWRAATRSSGRESVGSSGIQRVLERCFRYSPQLAGAKFFVWSVDPMTGKRSWWLTPLFMALCTVECADVLFALDSVPAIFAVTQDPFIVYTSNIFAILGLRALYFALAAMIAKFHYLKHALALILGVIGLKILAADFIGEMLPAAALTVTLAILVGGIVLSWLHTTRVGPSARTVK